MLDCSSFVTPILLQLLNSALIAYSCLLVLSVCRKRMSVCLYPIPYSNLHDAFNDSSWNPFETHRISLFMAETHCDSEAVFDAIQSQVQHFIWNLKHFGTDIMCKTMQSY